MKSFYSNNTLSAISQLASSIHTMSDKWCDLLAASRDESENVCD